MTKTTGLNIQVPETLIEDLVRAEIVRALGDNPRMIESVVKVALETKKNSYDRESRFQSAFKAAIQQEAEEVFKAWIAENRAMFKEALAKELQRMKAKKLKELCGKIVDGLAHVYVRNVSLDISEDD
jgi:hypothetical protein